MQVESVIGVERPLVSWKRASYITTDPTENNVLVYGGHTSSYIVLHEWPNSSLVHVFI